MLQLWRITEERVATVCGVPMRNSLFQDHRAIRGGPWACTVVSALRPKIGRSYPVLIMPKADFSHLRNVQ